MHGFDKKGLNISQFSYNFYEIFPKFLYSVSSNMSVYITSTGMMGYIGLRLWVQYKNAIYSRYSL